MMKIRAGIYNEMIKLMYRKRYSYLLMLVFLISISMGLIGKFVNGIIGLYISNFPITVLSVLMTFVLSFIIFMVVADLFTLEQEDGTIKAVLTRPVSRIGVYISKILAIFIYTCMILLVGLISSLIFGVFFNSFSSISIGYTILSYIISALPIVPIIFFAVTISQIIKSASGIVMVSILTYLAIYVITIIFPQVYPASFTSYTGWYLLFIGTIIPVFNIINIAVLFIVYSLIFFAISFWLFDKR